MLTLDCSWTAPSFVRDPFVISCSSEAEIAQTFRLVAAEISKTNSTEHSQMVEMNKDDWWPAGRCRTISRSFRKAVSLAK